MVLVKVSRDTEVFEVVVVNPLKDTDLIGGGAPTTTQTQEVNDASGRALEVSVWNGDAVRLTRVSEARLDAEAEVSERRCSDGRLCRQVNAWLASMVLASTVMDEELCAVSFVLFVWSRGEYTDHEVRATLAGTLSSFSQTFG